MRTGTAHVTVAVPSPPVAVTDNGLEGVPSSFKVIAVTGAVPSLCSFFFVVMVAVTLVLAATPVTVTKPLPLPALVTTALPDAVAAPVQPYKEL